MPSGLASRRLSTPLRSESGDGCRTVLTVEPALDERERRLFAASEARAAGHGGVVAVSRATGIARSTIDRGLADLRSGAVMSSARVRRQGGAGMRRRRALQ